LASTKERETKFWRKLEKEAFEPLGASKLKALGDDPREKLHDDLTGDPAIEAVKRRLRDIDDAKSFYKLATQIAIERRKTCLEIFFSFLFFSLLTPVAIINSLSSTSYKTQPVESLDPNLAKSFFVAFLVAGDDDFLDLNSAQLMKTVNGVPRSGQFNLLVELLGKEKIEVKVLCTRSACYGQQKSLFWKNLGLDRQKHGQRNSGIALNEKQTLTNHRDRGGKCNEVSCEVQFVNSIQTKNLRDHLDESEVQAVLGATASSSEGEKERRDREGLNKMTKKKRGVKEAAASITTSSGRQSRPKPRD
jgi:hypothetical protein